MGGEDIYFYASICSSYSGTPFIKVDGTEGIVVWNYEGLIQFYNKDSGQLLEKISMPGDSFMDMYSNMLDYIEGKAEKLCCRKSSLYKRQKKVCKRRKNKRSRLYTLKPRHVLWKVL